MNKKQREEKEQERESAKKHLLTLLRPGDTVYTSLDKVSASGITRYISVYIARIDKNRAYANGRPYIKRISWEVAKVLDYKQNNTSLIVGGGGMDMGFHVVYSLSRSLFDKKFKCIGEGCPSNDHSNGEMNPAKDHKGELHSDAGYALNQEWL